MKLFRTLAVTLCVTAFTTFASSPYTVYPVPQSQSISEGSAKVSPVVNIVAAPGIDEVTVNRAKQILAQHNVESTVSKSPRKGRSNIVIGVNATGDVADKEARRQKLDRSVFEMPKYDRHIISMTSDKDGLAQFLVLGENTDAAFYALATIEQMLDNGLDDLAPIVFNDYADQASRGIIEGYYGVPYNADVTKDLFPFMARYKMNTYMYGAKSDPYHTRYWDIPYPDSITAQEEEIGYLTRDMLKDIVETAHDNKVNFIWAIHPGNAFIDKNDTDVNDRIMNKFQDMYDLGVRQFGVFVDDVGVPYDKPSQLFGADRLTDLQEKIDARWNNGGSKNAADTVKPLQYVPQLYAYSWTTPERAQGFFESLSGTPEKIDIYITGANVWSVPNNRDLERVSQWLGRDVAWWWNYPCNDNDMTKIFPMDMYSNFHDETHISDKARMQPELKGLRTLIANPMQQGEVSKIALFSVGDYAWNNAAFDNDASWNASLEAIVGKEKAPAMRKALPYMRYYDEPAFGKFAGDYRKSFAEGNPRPEPVIEEMEELLAACRDLATLKDSELESDRLLYADMRPWLNKLTAMAQLTIDMLRNEVPETFPDFENDPAFQFEVLNGMGEDIELSIRTAEPAAQSLLPFINWLKDEYYIEQIENSALACATEVYSLPGVPFMHKIRPAKSGSVVYPVNLPEGLKWNDRRKLIEGSVDKEGEYSYDIAVVNDGDTTIVPVTLLVSSNLQQPVPVMGWLSWNVVEGEISEDVVKEVADAMVSSGLKDAGYEYLIIDDLWHSKEREAKTGRPMPDSIKFPNGMKAVADYVHSKGLKFGIYSDAGSKTCAGCYGSYGYENIDAKTYASWDVDLLKYDYCFVEDEDTDAAGAYRRYKTMGDALKNSGRDILLYMCEWGAREPWKWGAGTGATTWRCTFDTRDGWNGKPGGIGIVQSVEGMKDLWPYAGVNRFNDADMMCVGINGTGKSSSDLVDGKPGMTPTEYQTQFALWCMWGSPLTLSFDLRKPISPADLKIITNKELIEVNQDPMGQQAEFILETPEKIQVYAKDLANGDVAVAVVNMGDKAQKYNLNIADIPALEDFNRPYVRDIINKKNIGYINRGIGLQLQPHETKAFRIKKNK